MRLSLNGRVVGLSSIGRVVRLSSIGRVVGLSSIGRVVGLSSIGQVCVRVEFGWMSSEILCKSYMSGLVVITLQNQTKN